MLLYETLLDLSTKLRKTLYGENIRDNGTEFIATKCHLIEILTMRNITRGTHVWYRILLVQLTIYSYSRNSMLYGTILKPAEPRSHLHNLFLKIHFNIILPAISKYLKFFPSLRF
jgi:hypothetical protein